MKRGKKKEEKEIPIAIGIDIAKATMSICFHFQNGKENVLSIRNTETDIKEKLLPSMSQYTGKIVMESTGHYHWLVTLMLTEKNYDVRVVNPLLAKQYTSANIRKVKSDPADAKGLAKMARVARDLPNSFTEGKKSLWMRKKLGLLSSLSKQVQALEASLTSVREAQKIVKGSHSSSVTSIEETLLIFKKSMKVLEKECIQEGKKNEEIKKQMKLLQTIPGISEFGALLCLHWFSRIDGTTPKSWIAYSGLDVSVRESGTWRGRCRITKRGNAYLRKRLFSAAWGAWMANPEFKKYYEFLKKEGHPHTEALVIIARKLIRIMFSVLDTKMPYDSTKCFSKIA